MTIAGVGKQDDALLGRGFQEQGVALLQREEAPLRRVIKRYVCDDATVDDLFQEISLKVLRRLDTVRDRGTIRGWLFQLARNACLDYLRQQDRRPLVGPAALLGQRSAGDLGRNPAEYFLSEERVRAVYRAIERLPESQRDVVLLRIEEGLDHEQIAERLGISRPAVEVRLCRGRAAIKDQLHEILEGGL